MSFHIYTDSLESKFSTTVKESRLNGYKKTFKKSIDDFQSMKISNFQVQQEINGSTFELDKINNQFKIKWVGEVSLETASKLLTLGGDSVEYYGSANLLIDRSRLIKFDTEARIWIKNMIETRGKKLAPKVNKLAIVDPKSSIGRIFSNMVTATIASVLPGIRLREFDSCEEGLKWVLN